MGGLKVQMNESTVVEGAFETREIVASGVAELNKSEVEAQLDAAHRWPRSIEQFKKDAMSMATLTREVAESCLYAVPRDGKTIAGPSVRLAEICMAAYGNIHAGARVVDAEERFVVAQGVCWDIQKNVRVVMETKRRITTKAGKRFGDDMIGVTGNAAASIALRNAIFRVIPRALVDTIYEGVKVVAVGDAKTLAVRRESVVVRLQKLGVPKDRIFHKLGLKGIEDIGLAELEILVGCGTAIQTNGAQIDEVFPPIDDTADKAKSLEAELTGKKKPEPKEKPAAKAEPKAETAKTEARPGHTREIDPETGEELWIPNEEPKS